MTSLTNDQDFVQSCVESHTPGHSLTRAFYLDHRIYEADLDSVWRKGWLFAGFNCEIPDAGDYMTLQLGDDSVIVANAGQNKIFAVHNLCRHRGALLCDRSAGHAKRFVCPYHQWTYELDGSLVSCRGMQSDIDKSELSLEKVHVANLAGKIFICLGDRPPSFEPARNLVEPFATPQGLARARIAKSIDYEVNANWKVVWENNRECYHCNINHPEYIKANFDVYDKDQLPSQAQERLRSQLDRIESLRQTTGISATHKMAGIATFPDAENDIWYSANRTVLNEGFVTESLDGKRVAPLMGEYSNEEVGTLRIRTMPNMWNHSSCDHAVTTRLLPAGPEKTHVRVYWLVDREAQHGIDFELEKLLPFWQLTSEQDWGLCERVQRGVRSSQYRPGPFSTIKEYNVEQFIRWYLCQLLKR